MKINKELVGAAAEFAVASELGRRNVYAQPTFGHLKRTDLLIFGEKGTPLRIEVKGKQGDQWPNCKGISDNKSILVLVDFKGKEDTQRPDFYILTVSDWIDVVEQCIAKVKEKNPKEVVYRDENNVAVFESQRNRSGKPYLGMGIRVKDIEAFKERWDKITENLEGR